MLGCRVDRSPTDKESPWPNATRPDGITRREFGTRDRERPASIAVGGELLRARGCRRRLTSAAASSAPTIASSPRASASAARATRSSAASRRLKNVEIKTLCDIDANLAPERINDARLSDVATFKPGFVQDLRRVLDDKDIDAVVIATPNHWHALATIWALQAGKHVYVEKPSSHTVWEGRKMVEATARYNKIVQVGTMNRSRPAVRDAIKFIHEGGLGKVYMARGLCYKPRPAIGKYSGRSDGARREVRAHASRPRRTSRPTTQQYLSKVDYDLWLGPAPKRPFNRNRFHYNWHWHWDYGNGDSGNQGPHQFDIARWGLQKQEHPVKIRSVGGYFGDGVVAGNAEPADQPLRVRRRHACSSSARAAASPTTRAA